MILTFAPREWTSTSANITQRHHCACLHVHAFEVRHVLVIVCESSRLSMFLMPVVCPLCPCSSTAALHADFAVAMRDARPTLGVGESMPLLFLVAWLHLLTTCFVIPGARSADLTPAGSFDWLPSLKGEKITPGHTCCCFAGRGRSALESVVQA